MCWCSHDSSRLNSMKTNNNLCAVYGVRHVIHPCPPEGWYVKGAHLDHFPKHYMNCYTVHIGCTYSVVRKVLTHEGIIND